MVVELIAEDGGERLHRCRLQNLVKATTGPVRVASAYVTDDELLGVANRKVQLLTSLERMDVISGATSLHRLKSLIKSGVKCHCLCGGPRFHAKVYIFGNQQAVVTSANLTKSALDSNIEVGVQLSGAQVDGLIAWFDSIWRNAKSLDIGEVTKWETETAGLRRQYAELRRLAAAKPALPNEAFPSVRSSRDFLTLTENAGGFYACNTNRRHSPDRRDENIMRNNRYAIAWTDFKHPSHMKGVRAGDAIFMFAKSVGIVGVGRAAGKLEVLRPRDPARLTPGDGNNEEWRVPVDDWLVWIEHESDAFRWIMPNATFLDVRSDDYAEFRTELREHFLRY